MHDRIEATGCERPCRLAAIVVAAVLTGCAGFKPATLPVTTIAAPCGQPVDTLLVLLPGIYGHASEFASEGFVDAVRARGLAVDVALADATFPFYRDRDIAIRLDADVVAPALARGIRHFWFAGISLGGLGSLIYANESRADLPAATRPRIDGLLLIAPYLGERSIVAEVTASGGLAGWAPTGTIPHDDDDRHLWQWLKTLTIERRQQQLPLVYLGSGVDDRFAAAHRLLAAALPADHVFTAPGGHDWDAWRAVWPRMLDAAPLPRCANADAPATGAQPR